MRFEQGVANSGLGGEVDHTVRAMGFKKRGHQLAVRHVEARLGEVFVVFDQRQPIFLKLDIVVVAEIVETDHFIAAFQQAL